MDKAVVRDYYNHSRVVDSYAHATTHIGLWKSEEILFKEAFQPTDRLLDVGTGTGRIALGLCALGYTRIHGVDLSGAMIKRAQRLGKILQYEATFQVMDACALNLGEASFDGAIFGFNGLMQIPGRDQRRLALTGIRRVVKPGGLFVFTTHDRQLPAHRRMWKAEAARWDAGKQDRSLLEFGDRYEDSEHGRLYVHVPAPNEVRDDLKAAGWKCDSDAMRSKIAIEPGNVCDFADECRFWIARNPD